MNYGKNIVLPFLAATLLAIGSPALHATPKAAEHKDAEVTLSTPETQVVAPKPTRANVQKKSTRPSSKAKKPNKSSPVQKKPRTVKRK